MTKDHLLRNLVKVSLVGKPEPSLRTSQSFSTSNSRMVISHLIYNWICTFAYEAILRLPR